MGRIRPSLVAASVAASMKEELSRLGDRRAVAAREGLDEATRVALENLAASAVCARGRVEARGRHHLRLVVDGAAGSSAPRGAGE